jgi:hypothetical protein
VFHRDRHHGAAARFLRDHPHARLILTELIAAEVATRARALVGADRAVAFVRSLLDSRRYEVLNVDNEILRAALDRMEHFADKRLSLTDCASFELMDRLGLESAFTFDRDFRDCGYRMVP